MCPFSLLILAVSAIGSTPTWNLEDGGGIRHGWDLPHPPPTTDPNAPLTLTVPTTAFGVPPDAVARGETLVKVGEHIEHRRGRQLLATYSGLRAWDATGADLPATMSVRCEASCEVLLHVDERAATYPITVDPLAVIATFESTTDEPLKFLAPVHPDLFLAFAGGFEETPVRVHAYLRDETNAFTLVETLDVDSDIPTRAYSKDGSVLHGDELFLYHFAFTELPVVGVSPEGHLEHRQTLPLLVLDDEYQRVSIAVADDWLIYTPDERLPNPGTTHDLVVHRREVDGRWEEQGTVVSVEVPEAVLTNLEDVVRVHQHEGDLVLLAEGELFAYDVDGYDLTLLATNALEPLPGSNPHPNLKTTPGVGGHFMLTYTYGSINVDPLTLVRWDGATFHLDPVPPEVPYYARGGLGGFWFEVDVPIGTGPTYAELVLPADPPFQLRLLGELPFGASLIAALGDDLVVLDSSSLELFREQEPPTVQVEPLLVDEGGSAPLSAAWTIIDPDSDLEGMVYTSSFFTEPEHGEITTAAGVPVYSVSLGEEPTYQHDGSERPADGIEFLICDASQLCSDWVRMPVVVAPVNDPPITQPDGFTVDEGATVAIDLLRNDRDVDSELFPEDVQIAEPAATGTLLADATGLSFVHDGAEVTEDAFTYLACDPDGACTESEVTVVVVPVNDVPAPVLDVATVQEGGTVLLDPLANDVDPDSSLDPADLTLLSVPEGASVQVVAGGLQITHDGREPVGPGEEVPSFGYRICDDVGACGDGVVQLEVLPVNDAPVAAPDTVSLDEGGEGVAQVLANDVDPDDTVLAIELLDVPPMLQATVQDGAIHLVHDSSEPLGPAPVVAYQACDAAGACSASALTVQVQPVDDAPVATDDAATVAEGQRTWVSVLANDLDPDSVLTDVSLTESPEHGTATAVAGLVEYTHDGSETGADAFAYEVCDGSACSQARVVLTVQPVDDLPAVVDDRYAGTSPLEVSGARGVLANDRDDDGALSAPELVEPPLHGTLTLRDDGGFLYEADKGTSGADRFVYAVDGVTGAVWLEVESGKGCGCASASWGPLWLLGLLPLVARRRSARSGSC